MTLTATGVLASFKAGSVLSLVLPAVVLIAVVVWYVWLWKRDAGAG